MAFVIKLRKPPLGQRQPLYAVALDVGSLTDYMADQTRAIADMI